MKFMELWDRFAQTGDIEDYLEYCAWNGSVDLTKFVISSNMVIESGDLSGFKADSNGTSA